MKSGSCVGAAPHRSSTEPTSTEPRPIVTISTEMALSPSIGRITARSITAPSNPPQTSATGIAAHHGRPRPAVKEKKA